MSVENADQLHRAIGQYLITNRKVLSPKDVGVLRKNMDLTQEELATRLGITSQSVADTEKGETIPGPADRLMRIFYGLHLLPENARSAMLKELAETAARLSEIDESDDEPVYFGAGVGGWKKSACRMHDEMMHAS